MFSSAPLAAQHLRRLGRKWSMSIRSEFHMRDDDHWDEPDFEERSRLRRPRRKSRRKVNSGMIVVVVAILLSLAGLTAAGIFVLRSGMFGSRPSSSNWEEVVSPEGGFRVLFPTAPRKAVRSVSSQAGQVTDTAYLLDTPDWSMAVRFADFDKPGQANVAMEEIVNAGRNGTVKALGGNVTSEKEISLAGHEGKEVIVNVPGRGTSWLRWYIVKRRIYTVVIMSHRATPHSSDVARFLDSFQLTN
jgi:hypothetical protein